MTPQPVQPLRRTEYGGRQVGILVWTENGTWRSAWRLDAGAWHSLRGTHDGEEDAADAATQAAQDHLASGRTMPRRVGERGDGFTGDARPASAALTSQAWRARHAAWTQAQQALSDYRMGLPDEPSRVQQASLRQLEARAEEARRAMEGQLSRILRPQRRRPGVPRDAGTTGDPGGSGQP